MQPRHGPQGAFRAGGGTQGQQGQVAGNPHRPQRAPVRRKGPRRLPPGRAGAEEHAAQKGRREGGGEGLPGEGVGGPFGKPWQAGGADPLQPLRRAVFTEITGQDQHLLRAFARRQRKAHRDGRGGADRRSLRAAGGKADGGLPVGVPGQQLLPVGLKTELRPGVQPRAQGRAVGPGKGEGPFGGPVPPAQEQIGKGRVVVLPQGGPQQRLKIEGDLRLHGLRRGVRHPHRRQQRGLGGVRQQAHGGRDLFQPSPGGKGPFPGRSPCGGRRVQRQGLSAAPDADRQAPAAARIPVHLQRGEHAAVAAVPVRRQQPLPAVKGGFRKGVLPLPAGGTEAVPGKGLRSARPWPAFDPRRGGGLFVQQTAARPHGGIAHKAPHEHVIQQGVGRGHHAHAHVVGHPAAHNGVILAAGAGGGKIHRLVKAAGPLGVQGRDGGQILHGSPEIEGQRQKRGVGGDDRLVVRQALQRKRRQTVGFVAVVARVVRGGKAAFRHAPGQAAHAALLGGQARPQGFADKGALRHRQKQRGHKVLEQGAGPGGGHGTAAAAQQHPAQRPHMGRRYPPGGGLVKGGHAGLAHQQVVAGLGQGAGPGVIADIKQVAPPVVQKAHVAGLPQGGDQAVQRRGPLAAHLRQRPLQRGQAAEEVAAVHGGNVGRGQGRQGGGIVPVVKAAPVFWQVRHGL